VTDFSIRVERGNPHATVTATGEIDLATADDLARALSAVTDLAVRVDLTDVEFFGAAAVCAIAEGAAECARLGNRLVVTGYSPVTRTLFELCELEALLGEPARG
jgi:anti-anti-sigma factor